MNAVAGAASVASKGPRPRSREGSFGWAVDAFAASLRRWPDALPGACVFVAAAVLVVTLVHLFELPGGVLPALPVLALPMVPHSLRLLLQRLAAVAIACAASAVAGELVQQLPWLLLPLVATITFVGFYSFARGLDFFIFMIGVGCPALFFWNAAAGGDVATMVWTAAQQLFVGVLAAGLLGMAFLRGREEAMLRDRLAGGFESLAATLRLPPSDERHVGAEWSIQRSGETERLLARLRVRLGPCVAYDNFGILAAAMRAVLGWNRLRRVVRVLPHPPGSLETISGLTEEVRGKIALQCDALSAAIRAGRPAAFIDLEPVFAHFERRCREALATTGPTLSGAGRTRLETYSALYRMLQSVMRVAVEATGRRAVAIPDTVPLPSHDRDLGGNLPALIAELLRAPNRWVGLFAAKATLGTLIAFSFAAIYPAWGGAEVLVLMSLLLSSLSMGGINAAFSMRLVGLIAALFVALLTIVVALPNAQDPWVYAAVLAAALFPGAIAMQSPAAAPIGLSFAMSVFFALTASDSLSVSLAPIQDRFTSVFGATVISWAVFVLVRPVYARDRLNAGLAATLRALRDSMLLEPLSAGATAATRRASRKREESLQQIARAELATFDRIVGDATVELAMSRERVEILGAVRSSLEEALLAAFTLMRLREAQAMALADAPNGPAVDAAVRRAAALLGELADSLEGRGELESMFARVEPEELASARASIAADEGRSGIDSMDLAAAIVSMIEVLDLETRTLLGELVRRERQLEGERRFAVGGVAC